MGSDAPWWPTFRGSAKPFVRKFEQVKTNVKKYSNSYIEIGFIKNVEAHVKTLNYSLWRLGLLELNEIFEAIIRSF